jgi:hypothetical protein
LGDPIGAHVRYHNCTVQTHAQLGAVSVTDTDALLEAERRFPPRHRRSHIG